MDRLRSIDPNKGGATIDGVRTNSLYDGLTFHDYNANLTYVLASEMTPNQDASVWTIRLRSGVEFHNGKTLSADDVIYTLQYWLDPANTSYSKGVLSPYISTGAITKVDPLTVRLQLKQPLALLPELVSDPRMGIFQAGTTTAQLRTAPNGTGPFKFGSWIPARGVYSTASTLLGRR